jgi:tetratricopeptide (TPR) repeat protein
MRLRTAACLVITFLVAGAAGAQGNWSVHTNAGEYAYARRDFKRAESEFQAALEIAQALPAGDRRLETSLENLARLYENESDFNHAQPLYQLLLAATEFRVGTDDPALLNILYHVARVSQPMGDLPTVEDSLRRFAAIAAGSGVADPRQHWQALQMLARLDAIQKEPGEALLWQQRAAEVIVDDPAATNEERAMLLESLAEMELVAGNGAAAEHAYLEIAERTAEENEIGAVSRIMARAAETALAAGEPATAERLAMRALDAQPNAAEDLQTRKVLAEISWIEVNRGTDDMAVLLAAANDDEELERARDRLLSLNDLEGGIDRQTLTRLAQVDALRGQPAVAADWQRQLLELTAAEAGAAADVRRNLVVLLAAAGRYDEALIENAVALADLEAEYGATDSRLMPVLSQRLELLQGAGQKKEAKQVRKRITKLSRE